MWKTFTYACILIWIYICIYVYKYIYIYLSNYRLDCIYIYIHIFVAVNIKNHNNESFTFTKWISKKMGPQTICSAVSLTTFKQTSLTREWKLLLKVQVIFWMWKRFRPPKMGVQTRQKSEMNKRVVEICQDGVGYCWMIIKFFSIYMNSCMGLISSLNFLVVSIFQKSSNNLHAIVIDATQLLCLLAYVGMFLFSQYYENKMPARPSPTSDLKVLKNP